MKRLMITFMKASLFALVDAHFIIAGLISLIGIGGSYGITMFLLSDFGFCLFTSYICGRYVLSREDVR